MRRATTQKQLRRRGSAMIELAIVLVVFIVPVFLYSAYITEAIWFGLKAQEAAGAAAWSFTGRLLHDYDNYNHTSKYSAAAISVRKEIAGMYPGLDAWAVAALGQSPTFGNGMSTQAILQGGAVCDLNTKAAGSVMDPSDPTKFTGIGTFSTMSTLGSDLHSGGLVSCQAQVRVKNWYLNQATQQSEITLPVSTGSHANDFWPQDLLGDIQLCGVGHAQWSSSGAASGTCQNTGQAFTLYTDDWGLAEDESDPTPNDDKTNYQDYGSKVNTHFAKLGQVVYENEGFPIAYDGKVQAIEGAASMAFCSAALPVDIVAMLDKQYADSEPHNAFNLAYRRADPYSGSVPAALSRDDDSPDNQFEGSITQDSYTWPVRHYAAGPIGANAYLQMERNRKDTYLSQ
ncbi:MAG: hypothetical protein ACYDCL_17325 [Myxococcales bacterium]